MVDFAEIGKTPAILSSSGEDFFEMYLFIQLITGFNIYSFTSFNIFAGVSPLELFLQSISFIIFKTFLVYINSKEEIKEI